MNWYRREPTLKDILSDSAVRAVMEADHDPNEPEAMLKEVSRIVRALTHDKS